MTNCGFMSKMSCPSLEERYDFNVEIFKNYIYIYLSIYIYGYIYIYKRYYHMTHTALRALSLQNH